MIRIIPFSQADFVALSTWFASEQDVVQWGGPLVTFPLDASQLQQMLDEGDSEPPLRKCWSGVIGSEIVAHAQLAFDWRNGNATLARVAVAPAARGRDLAASMLRLVLEEGFRFHDVERIELNVYDWNTPAIRTYRRLGFVREGVRRSSTRVGQERWNTVIMGLLRSEWSPAKNPMKDG